MPLLKRRAGTPPAVFLFLALLSIAGCRDAPVVTDPGDRPPSDAPPNVPGGSLFISGVMTPQHQGIRVSRGGGPVTDASVTVNGVSIPHCCGDLYSGNLPSAVPAGGTLNVKVVAGGVTFEASGEVSAPPVITAPATGTTFAWTDPVRLIWSTPTDPDRFEVCLNCWENSLDGEIYTTVGSAREFNISPGALVDYGTGAIAAVYSFKGNFLRSASSAAVTSKVLFVARSTDALITIKY